MKGLLNIILLFVSSIVIGQTYSDTILINYGSGTTSDTGNFWNANRLGGKMIDGHLVTTNSNWYFTSYGTVTSPSWVPQGVLKSGIQITSGATLTTTIENISVSYARIILGIGTSSTAYDFNIDNYISVNSNPIDTIVPYLNQDLIDLGLVKVSGGQLQIKVGPYGGPSCLNYAIIYLIDTVVTYNYQGVVDTLVNPNSTALTKEYYKYLKYWYGKKILSGYTNTRFTDVTTRTGETPLIFDHDLECYTDGYPYAWSMEYNQPYGGNVFGQVDWGWTTATINKWKEGHLVALQHHWHAPSSSHGIYAGTGWDTLGARGEIAGRTNYNNYRTTFDPAYAIIEGTDEYNWFISDIDNGIVPQLQRYKDSNVVVLLRPFHEASGGWFWWGTSGKTVFAQLWHIYFDRIVNYHNINNIIWLLAEAYPSNGWTVSEDEFDIIGFDHYPGAYNYDIPISSIEICRTQVNNKKMVAIMETGPIPSVPDLVSNDLMPLFIAPWGAESMFYQNDSDNFVAFFQDTNVVNFGFDITDTLAYSVPNPDPEPEPTPEPQPLPQNNGRKKPIMIQSQGYLKDDLGRIITF